MSTYYVTHARKDAKGVITDLNTKKDGTTASAVSMTKSALIALIDKDKKPAVSDTAKTYTAKGESEDIKVIKSKYLRTDANTTEADNLDTLPSF